MVACAEAWRGDGATLASPMGLIPSLGARLARLTFAPDLLLTDGEAYLVDADGQVEGWLPYAKVFTMLAAGRRHVMMGAAQIEPVAVRRPADGARALSRRARRPLPLRVRDRTRRHTDRGRLDRPRDRRRKDDAAYPGTVVVAGGDCFCGVVVVDVVVVPVVVVSVFGFFFGPTRMIFGCES